MGSRIPLNFFVIVALVFIASANGAGVYRLLAYSEEFPHPWHKLVQRAWSSRIHRSQVTQDNGDNGNYVDLEEDYRNRAEFDNNITEAPETKRQSSFEETNELDNFRKDSGLNVIYSRMPMPVILVPSYPK